MTVEDNRALVRRFINEVWSLGNLDLIHELVAKEHVHHLSRRDIEGPAGVRQLVQ
jgi:hypothetical protein